MRTKPFKDAKSNALYLQYQELAALETKLVFDRRLGEYRYYDMDPVVQSALKTAKTRW